MELKQIKEELISELQNIGIPEFKLTLKNYRKNPKGYLGCYRSLSQFRGNPIICIDIEKHAEEISKDYMLTPERLKENVMETLFHEYGHVIEEFIRKDCYGEGNRQVLEKLYEFRDMEDFAESFSRWISGRDTYSEEEETRFKDIVNYYVEKVFEPEAIDWVRQEKWKRELDFFLDHNEKSFDKFKTMIGAFDNCKIACEKVVKKMNHLGLDIKILKLIGYSGDINQTHPKWQNIGKDNVIHYVLEFNNEWIVDLTAKQFSEKNPTRLIVKKEDYIKNWSEYSIKEDNKEKIYKKIKP
jgi:hypothetical protein